MIFGTSFSLVYVDSIDWVHTKLWKRCFRGLIGVMIAYGITVLIDYLLEGVQSFLTIYVTKFCV